MDGVRFKGNQDFWENDKYECGKNIKKQLAQQRCEACSVQHFIIYTHADSSASQNNPEDRRKVLRGGKEIWAGQILVCIYMKIYDLKFRFDITNFNGTHQQ